MTRLVESVEERTLLLLDEPESHLHPPLLSAFVALSDLLVNRNGVGIIAAHSPVVLQGVPRECVWRLRRAGDSASAERPDIETFGENVGTLTSEVFGLEVTNSGFHRMITEAAAGQASYGEVLETFGGELGSEARALLEAPRSSSQTTRSCSSRASSSMLIRVTACCGRPVMDCGAIVLLATPETPQTRLRTVTSCPSAGALPAVVASSVAVILSSA